MIVCILILSAAVPAQAAPRHLRLYKGETSQGDSIRFVVARTNAGRFVQKVNVGHITLTCEDDTTLELGFGYGFARTMVPITDGAFSFDDVFWDTAFHVAGELGRLQGQGTLSRAQALITPDEQATQLCTSGELTWEVELVRTISPAKLDAPAGYVLRAA